MSEAKPTPEGEALFAAIEYAVLRKMNGFDPGELGECRATLYRLMEDRADLLEAARMCLFALDGGTGHADAETRRKHLRAAINKADGK